MSSKLPQSIVPERLAETASRIGGQLELRGMTRLVEILNDSRGAVQLELRFGRNEQGVVRITGRYETRLELVCQRCLEPFTTNLSRAINVGVVFDRGGLNRLPEALEPLLLKQEALELIEFIEDEILLGLPISPKHRPEDCPAGGPDEEGDAPRQNPFHVLKELKIR